ncbi:hypothetical protein Plhal304r1_c061g0148651 [Plasmopara halstedii]
MRNRCFDCIVMINLRHFWPNSVHLIFRAHTIAPVFDFNSR